jgi:hypothetical protein
MEHDKKIKPETPDYIRFNNKILRKMCSHKNGRGHLVPPPTGNTHPSQYQICKQNQIKTVTPAMPTYTTHPYWSDPDVGLA